MGIIEIAAGLFVFVIAIKAVCWVLDGLSLLLK